MNRFSRLLSILICVGWAFSIYAVTETRIHEFGKLSPQMVESRIRLLVPDRARVSMNPAVGKVIVVAEPEVQEQISAMLRELAKPRKKLVLRYRHNRDQQELVLENGDIFTLPVSQTPPPSVVQDARRRLFPDHQNKAVAGSVLQAQVMLLRDDPPVVRLSITPVVLLGDEPPYDVYRYDRLRMDVMINTREYLDLPNALSTHSFYSTFLRTRPGERFSEKPIALLLSLDEVLEEQSGEAQP